MLVITVIYNTFTNYREINKEKIEVNELVHQAISHVALQVEQREGSVETHLDSDELFIEADFTHIENVLVNILDNANKYSPEKPSILVSTHHDSSWVYIKISDKGKGMTQEVRKQVFERFYREERGNIHNVKGHGLGLAYVKQIIDDHQGEIFVESEKGKGTTFIIKLPLIS